MGKGYRHGSEELSYGLQIVGGTTRPKNPTQGMVWANTPNEITHVYLADVKPSNPVAGGLWLKIGDSGNKKIVSPVSKEWITVYPLSAEQYINGAWVTIEAVSYLDGEWVGWIFVILQSGKKPKITGITGATASQWSIADGVLTLTRTSGQSSVAYTSDVYNFAGQTRLCFTVIENSNTSTQFHVSTCGVDTNDSISITSIDGTGSFYIDIVNSPVQGRIRFDFGLGTFKVTNMYLE